MAQWRLAGDWAFANGGCIESGQWLLGGFLQLIDWEFWVNPAFL
jgi:hypothetical protein